MPYRQPSTYRNTKSLPFIQQSQKGIEINPDAVQFLSSLPQKHCHVLTIVGRAKTGKSTLMNHLVHRLTMEDSLEEYFPVSDHLGGGTKGINILTEYVELGDDHILLFLDVEGLGRFNNSESYESRIFTLSLLLSTTLMYNNIGPIDEQALQNLSVFIEIGKMFEKSIIKREEGKDGDFGMPSLFMVLRDFSLKLENKEGFDVTAKQYLEAALSEQKGGSQTIFHKNRIRRTIKELFRDRSCETLVLPSDELPLNFRSPLRHEFSADLTRLVGKVLANERQSHMNRKLLLPSQFSIYANQVIATVNTNIRVPQLSNILCNVYQKQIQTSKQEFKSSLQKISKQFDKKVVHVENLMNSIKIQGSFQQNFIEDEIVSLEKVIDDLEEIYAKSHKEIEQFIKKQRSNDECNRNQSLIDTQQLKTLEATKKSKEEEIKKRIEDLRDVAAMQKRMMIKQQQQLEQSAQFQRTVEQLCLVQDDKQLEKKYRSFIYDLKDRCDKVSSKYFETGILKCEVAFLRRKLELKERNQRECPSCKFSKAEQSSILKEREINPQVQPTLKTVNNHSKDLSSDNTGPSKSFYIPYIILSDPTIMNVEIIRTLIKQDHKLNNYIEYVLEVVIMERRWMFNRKWKDFNELHSILANLFDSAQLPPFANAQLGLRSSVQFHKEEVQERRRNLEQYLRKLLSIQPIRNSRIMQKFLKINKQYVSTL